MWRFDLGRSVGTFLLAVPARHNAPRGLKSHCEKVLLMFATRFLSRCGILNSVSKIIRILVSGGPGAGCTSTASAIGDCLGMPVFDSDSYFHKPTDPPFQEQYSPDERRRLLGSALARESSWILSGSVATWGVDIKRPTHGVFLCILKEVRLKRLELRQRRQFGSRIDHGGDMRGEHESFMTWAGGYGDRTGVGRNAITDRMFLEKNCERFVVIAEDEPLQEIVSRIVNFVSDTVGAKQNGGAGAV